MHKPWLNRAVNYVRLRQIEGPHRGKAGVKCCWGWLSVEPEAKQYVVADVVGQSASQSLFQLRVVAGYL